MLIKNYRKHAEMNGKLRKWKGRFRIYMILPDQNTAFVPLWANL